MRKHLLLLCLLFSCLASAQQVTRYLLDTVDSGSGSWPCLYYELNTNADITLAEKAKWASLEEDESHWVQGVGPFSTDQNKFFVTDWASEVHPLLVRRHFTLTAEDIANINAGKLVLTYSYDENPKIWINGTLLTSSTGWNDNNYATYTFLKQRKQVLREGDNVLAISVQQGAGGGHIDCGLYVTYTPSADGIVECKTDMHDQPMAYNLVGQRVCNVSATNTMLVMKGKKILTN